MPPAKRIAGDHDVGDGRPRPHRSNSTFTLDDLITTDPDEEDDNSNNNNNDDGEDQNSNPSVTKSQKSEQTQDTAEQLGMKRATAKWLRCSKISVFVVLMVAASLGAYLVYRTTSSEETKAYKADFKDVANSIATVAEINAKAAVKTYETVSLQITSHASATGSVWPNVTVPKFEALAQQLSRFTETTSSGISVLVDQADRAAYEEYKAFTNPVWIRESLDFMGRTDEALPFVFPYIHNELTETGFNISGPAASGVYCPLAQVSPVDFSFFLNFDNYGTPSTEIVYRAAAESKSTIFSYVVNMDANVTSENDWPASFMASPIMEDVTEDSPVVGILVGNLLWHSFFRGLLPEDGSEIYLVVRNTCNQEFTYVINGPNVDYLGEGDWHESPSDELVISKDFTAFTSLDLCRYSLHIYPSQGFYDKHHSFEPILSTVTVLVTFAATAIVFLLYDILVERRQSTVMKKASKSHAIISSLFPANVRERLMADAGETSNSGNDNGENKSQPHRTWRLASARGDAENQGARSMFGNGNNINSMQPLASGTGHSTPGGMSKPIADLFPHTSVLFSDLVGFTSWSSTREPTEVFTLLETLYNAFDRIARKMKVFKVETIGDCYMAACGLPDPNVLHAAVLTKFAKTCLSKLDELLHELAVTLGPTTRDLAMRTGIHSGPVTAGVLRGEKSRFQLFGDTVNTAARMESTGERSRIQISQETADELIACGRQHWITPRADKVNAKGKGELQTYWVLRRSHGDDVTNSSAPSVSSFDDMASIQSFNEEEDGMHEFHDEDDANKVTKPIRLSGGGSSNPSKKRWSKKPRSDSNTFSVISSHSTNSDSELAVKWNVEILQRVIKKIIAMRNPNATLDKQQFSSLRVAGSRTGQTALDEVKEVIELPNKAAAGLRANEQAGDPESIQLSPIVCEQILDFVRVIESMYNDNPFHSFSHASHVVQSTVKLLSRIVVSESIDYSDMTYKTMNKDLLHRYTYGITSDPITQFACVLAALIHDVDHPGVPNAQLVKEGAQVAKFYRDKSVAEQNSLDMAWDLLMLPQYTEFRACIYSTQEELDRFRQLLVNAVMATDIMDKELGALRKGRWEKAFDTTSVAATSTNADPEQEQSNRMATIVIEHLIQASDVAHTMQHWNVYCKWNERLFDEMYQAYLNERSEVDPSVNWYEGEIGFFDFYLIPLAKKLKECGVFGVSSDEYLTYAQSNREQWLKHGKRAIEEYMRKYNLDHEMRQ
eukprot:CAMPEP_0119548166 /NCGR_PEP_ID=MMETSP1352-20130426/2141_1 /TAXON_ID=265584 /ORGANISM="Stauroneis constricta, Strain CCMP1120" /LENGTH=1235 /DNA_ID=CAMNT_0007593355 /DNA_START=105 /DNA_END=3812 /DNA_ORIENTATION=-